MDLFNETVSTKELASWLMVSERRIQQLARLNVVPRAERGRFVLGPAVQAYIGAVTDTSSGGILPLRERLLKAKVTLAEIEVAKVRREVVQLDIVERVAGEEYATIRAKLLALPDRMAPLMETTPGADARRELLRECVVEALTELSEGGSDKYFTAPADRGDEPAADEPEPAGDAAD